MRAIGWLRAVTTAIFLLCPAIGLTAPALVAIRSGDHPGFGRLVFDLPAGTIANVVVNGDLVTVALASSSQMTTVPRLPRNVLAIRIKSASEARIAIAAGSKMRRSGQASRLVLDFLDPPVPVLLPPVGSRASNVVGATSQPVPHLVRQTVSPAAREPVVAVARSPSVPSGVGSKTDPPSLELIAKPLGGSRPGASDAALVPFDANTGAAAFRHNTRIYIVFDERRPIDMTRLLDLPAFAGAAIRLVPNGTVLSIPAPVGVGVTFAREPTGWSVSLRPSVAADRAEALSVEFSEAEVRVSAETPGRVVTVVDPESGASFLVGTLRQPHAATATARQTPEFRILATFLGVVVEPVSDQMTMRATRSGFIVSGGPAATLAVSGSGAVGSSEVKALSRRFDFPPLEMDALLRRLQAAQAAAAAAPPQSRTARRVEVAQALLALGLGPEAQSLLSLASADDGHTTDSPDIAALRAIAAVVSGRLDEASVLEDGQLDGSDETTLWRGLLTASKGQNVRAAALLLAATYPILLDYPAPLRDRMLPLVAETLTRGAESATARRLIAARPTDSRLDLARAAIARTEARENDTAAATQILERVAHGGDRLLRSRALGELVELKLATHALSAAQGADELDKSLYAWRGDELELQRRIRVAALRCEAGQWKAAIELLRESIELWPDRAKDVRQLLSVSFERALAAEGSKSLSPFDLVTLAADNVDLLPDGPKGLELAGRISDQLEHLELPRRSADVLGRLVASGSAGGARAEFGARLAAQRLQFNDPGGALDALNASAATDLPPALLERRTLIFARSAAASGNAESAIAALRALDTVPALQLQVELLERADNWQGASEALHDLVRRTVPNQGTLDQEASMRVVRLASAAARAGDRGGLSSIRSAYLTRLGSSDFARMLNVVTAAPLDGVADLARAAQEARLARTLPETVRTVLR